MSFYHRYFKLFQATTKDYLKGFFDRSGFTRNFYNHLIIIAYKKISKFSVDKLSVNKRNLYKHLQYPICIKC